MTLSWNQTMLSIAERRAADLPAGTGPVAETI